MLLPLRLLCAVLCTPFEFEYRPSEDVLREYRRAGHPTLLVLQQGILLEKDVLFVKDVKKMGKIGIRTKHFELDTSQEEHGESNLLLYLITMKECIRIKERTKCEITSTFEYWLDERKYRNRVYSADKKDLSELVERRLSALVFFNNEQRTGVCVEGLIRETRAVFGKNCIELPIWRYDGEADIDALRNRNTDGPCVGLFVHGHALLLDGDFGYCGIRSLYSKGVLLYKAKNPEKEIETRVLVQDKKTSIETTLTDETAIVVFTDIERNRERADRAMEKAARIEKILSENKKETFLFHLDRLDVSSATGKAFETNIFLYREGLHLFGEENNPEEIVKTWIGLGGAETRMENKIRRIREQKQKESEEMRKEQKESEEIGKKQEKKVRFTKNIRGFYKRMTRKLPKVPLVSGDAVSD
ncbi:MAG: uncharacterized protein A8A55_0644 [Amphiamblys sp. WSBS2006]|nr:MAG: uncharacterized protein A8A55_0644 [Amphiamblys sp. WSBS2006]